jgi:hypothetical protein
MNCCICNKDKPDGKRWIYVAGGMAVCSVECQERRIIKFNDIIAVNINNKPNLKKLIELNDRIEQDGGIGRKECSLPLQGNDIVARTRRKTKELIDSEDS